MTSLDLSHFEDVLGQLPRLKTYTHVLLCFSNDVDDPRFGVIASLESACRKLFDSFPWLSCRVVHEGASAESSGTFRLAPCPRFTKPNPIVHVEDCRNICPKYKDILVGKGHVALFDGKVLTSVPAFPQLYDDATLNPAPVLTLQANIVDGGVLLDIAAQHNFIDGGGLLRLLELLSKCMRGEEFNKDELEHGNCDRSDLIRLLQPDEPLLDHSHLIREPLSNIAPLAKQPEASWGFVRFPASTISSLKARANADILQTSGVFVSSNDALSAFIWKCISAVRLQRRQMPHDFSKFSRALDARRALGIPRDYLGQMGYNATCRLSFRELEEQSLGEIALFMRQAVEKVNNEYSVRSWATFVANEPDKSKIMFGGSFNPDSDIGMSSLVHSGVSGMEFGALGKPDLVRRPDFLPLQSCVYLWTQTVHGAIDVLLCLREVDWKALRADGQWAKHTEYIG